MPSIDRTTILKGPAIVTFGGQSFWSKGDVTLRPIKERFEIETAAFGKVDERVRDKRIEVSFEPSGRFTTALAAVLWPYAATAIGTSVFGATDSPLVVHGKDGVKITVHNAALTEMPSIRLGVAQTIQGSCTFQGLLANSTDPTAAAAYYTVASEAYPGDTGFNSADILTRAYSAAWGGAPWDAFMAEAGWEISFGLQLAPQMVDGLGTVDMSLRGIDVSARAIPVGPSMADVMTAMGNTQAMGASVAGANDLVITGTGVYVEINKAGLTETDMGWGAERKRIGQTTWIATRTVTAGAADPLFYVGTAAPV